MTTNYYWKRHPDARFATLLRLISAHCHPEAYEEAYDDLIELAHEPDPPEEVRVFKDELRDAVVDPGQLPSGALFTAAEYGDGSDEAFLRRLWHDLYGDEPVDRER